MAFRPPPVWASLPYTQLQLSHVTPVLAYHSRFKPGAPEHVVRGLFTLGVGLAGVLGMVLYEMGYGRTAFVWSVTTATIGAFVAAAEVAAAYNPQPPQPDIPPIDV